MKGAIKVIKVKLVEKFPNEPLEGGLNGTKLW